MPKFYSNLFLCDDIKKTAEFYKQLGFDIEKSEDTVRIIFGDFRLAFMDDKKATIHDKEALEKGVGIYTYFEVDDVDAFYKELVEKGLSPSSEPRDWPWGKREFVIRDPDGFKLVFFSKI